MGRGSAGQVLYIEMGEGTIMRWMRRGMESKGQVLHNKVVGVEDIEVGAKGNGKQRAGFV